MAGELTCARLAKRHNISRQTAYRWLLELEEQYGPAVVARRGKRGVLITTEEAFAKVAPLAASNAATERRFRELEERIGDVETRTDKLAERMSEAERRARK